MASLPERYEIRTLKPEHLEWTKAIVSHANIFYSPLWAPLYPEGQTKRAYGLFETSDYLMSHQINSGYSLGVFDKEYQFRRPESAATGGKLYWDMKDENATADELLEQMDFPLVSIAMAYDGVNPLNEELLGPLVQTLPLFANLDHAIETLDKRDAATWKATGPQQVLMRNSTATLRSHEGQGLARLCAEEMMRRSEKEGFRAIKIDTASEGLSKVWSTPPAPYQAEVIVDFHTKKYEETNEAGEKSIPFQAADFSIKRIHVKLR